MQPMNKVTELTEWQALTGHQREIATQHMRDWFAHDGQRFSRFHLKVGDILLDYSRNRITEHTLRLLCDLLHAVSLPQKIQGLFNGDSVNTTEQRPALHTALRDRLHSPLLIEGQNIAALIEETQQRMRALTAQIHAKTWKGVTGKPISHVVNIGIGGSYLGPVMCTQALSDFAVSDLQFHFISSVDQAHVSDILQRIDPEATLFIISSKSFSTLETMTNAQRIHASMCEQFGEKVTEKQFIAITACAEKARAFGIPQENIYPLWDFVGGRYSIWSAIGLPLMLMIGTEHFAAFLAGAYEMDHHFKHADFSQNMPVLLAMLGVWYTNFFGANVQAIVPYAYRLRYFIPYLQQADMESNGKNINVQGEAVSYTTGPVIFGEEGCNGQHAYHQLLHQGQHLIPVDFIVVGSKKSSEADERHDMLIASALSQAQALMRGKTYAEAYNALIAAQYPAELAKTRAKHQVVPGNRPSNTLFLEGLTPHSLGALIALYEHKIFVQGVVWNINSFDQWGVELGKQFLPAILQHVQGQNDHEQMDCATAGMIHHVKKIRES